MLRSRNLKARFSNEIGQSTERSWEWKEERSHAFVKEPIRLEYRQAYRNPRKSGRGGEEPSLGCCLSLMHIFWWLDIAVFSSLFSAIVSLCGVHLSLLHLVSADNIRGRRVEKTYRSHSLPHCPRLGLHGLA
jgi:hypothetical protein